MNSADASNPLQFTAIVPAQSLSGACVEIALTDGTIYYYHATSPIALKASATNTLNLRIADKKGVVASGAPVIEAWDALSNSGSLTESINNFVTLYWLAPHVDFATIDKITVSLVDMFNNRREIDVTPTIDPLSSAEYATLTFPLAIANAGYPQIVENLKLYAGSTLLRDSPREAIIGSVLSRSGAHTLGHSLDYIIINGLKWKIMNVGATTLEEHGNYYNWHNAQTACPAGWRLPTSGELAAMHGKGSPVTYYNNGVGWSASTPGWIKYTHGLQLPAAGFYHKDDGLFYDGGVRGFIWSSTKDGGDAAKSLHITNSSVIPQATNYMTYRFSVRCVQTAPPLPTVPTPPTADQVVTINGLKWATGNLVASNRQNAKVGKPEDGGIYFQFGSLLGWRGGAYGDGAGRPNLANGTFFDGAFEATDDVAVFPAVAAAAISAIGPTWPNQSQNLYYFGYTAAPYSTAFTRLSSFTGFTTGTLADKGVGDPCRYYLGGTWRLPTSEEYLALHKVSTASYHGSWAAQSTTSYLQYVASGQTIQFPASGCRVGTNGAIYNVGAYGHHYSESVYDAAHGYYLRFYSGNVIPQHADTRRYAFPVRCVSN